MTANYVKQNELYFNYLEELRQSGKVNTFGAVPYLEQEFGVSNVEAKELVTYFVKNYDEVIAKLRA